MRVVVVLAVDVAVCAFRSFLRGKTLKYVLSKRSRVYLRNARVFCDVSPSSSSSLFSCVRLVSCVSVSSHLF